MINAKKLKLRSIVFEGGTVFYLDFSSVITPLLCIGGHCLLLGILHVISEEKFLSRKRKLENGIRKWGTKTFLLSVGAHSCIYTLMLALLITISW